MSHPDRARPPCDTCSPTPSGRPANRWLVRPNGLAAAHDRRCPTGRSSRASCPWPGPASRGGTCRPSAAAGTPSATRVRRRVASGRLRRLFDLLTADPPVRRPPAGAHRRDGRPSPPARGRGEAEGEKVGAERSATARALGRSRGGLSSKAVVTVADDDTAIAVDVAPGQANDGPLFVPDARPHPRPGAGGGRDRRGQRVRWGQAAVGRPGPGREPEHPAEGPLETPAGGRGTPRGTRSGAGSSGGSPRPRRSAGSPPGARRSR